jgi:hypothetical protein
MNAANLRRIFGSRLFIWQPSGYFIVGILDRDGPGYTVIKAFKSNRPDNFRPTVGLGEYQYVNVERNELTLELAE